MITESVILDGCAIFWVIHWPAAGGTPTDFAENVLLYVLKLLSNSDVFLVLDRYNKPSIKAQAQAERGSANS